MNSLILRSIAMYIFLFISVVLCGCIFPTSGSCSNRETLNFPVENNDYTCVPTIDTLKCITCASISHAKYLLYNFVKKAKVMFTPGNTYMYKPPPSLFENLAVWTGAINENNSDDEIWASQKLFMLASAVIFSMLLLNYGHNWLSKLSRTTKIRNCGIYFNPKEFVMSRISSSVSFAAREYGMDEKIKD